MPILCPLFCSAQSNSPSKTKSKAKTKTHLQNLFTHFKPKYKHPKTKASPSHRNKPRPDSPHPYGKATFDPPLKHPWHGCHCALTPVEPFYVPGLVTLYAKALQHRAIDYTRQVH
jgi:hypothetical protein